MCVCVYIYIYVNIYVHIYNTYILIKKDNKLQNLS